MLISRLVLLVLLLISPVLAEATNLSTTAAALAPGTFVELTGMLNFNNGQIFQPGGCPTGNSGTAIFQFHNKGQWNPIAKRMQVVAASHDGCGGTGVRGIFYDDATNTWGDLPIDSARTDPTHRYDQNAIDPATGRHYTTDYDSFSSFFLNNGASSWVTITRPGPGSRQCCTADAFFPTFQGGGRFFHFDGGWGLWSFNPATSQWQEHFQGNGNDGTGLPRITGADTSVFNHYSGLCQCLIIGGGQGLYKISNTGAVTTMSLANGPSTFSIDGSGIGTNLVVDPVSGFLVAISSNGVVKQFDPTGTGTWTNVSVSTVGQGSGIPSFMQNAVDGGDAASHMMSAPIPDYGVIMYAKTTDAPGSANSAHVYIFKLQPSSSQPVLTVNKTGTGAATGTVTGNASPQINCGSTCSQQYAPNTVITLSHTDNGTTFGGWSGGGCSGTGTCIVTLAASTTVTASFTAPASGNSYSTNFTTAEAALCDASGTTANGQAGVCHWRDGAAVGSGFKNMQTISASPNYARGTSTSPCNPNCNTDDPVAVLDPATTGAWGPSQYVRTTVRCDFTNCDTGSGDEELEIHLNMTCGGTGCAGYEILKCAQIVRWYGPVGSFDGDGTHPVLPDTCTGTHCHEAMQSGDVFSAQHTGGVITVFRNGNVCNSTNDNTFTNGTPGIGWFSRNASPPAFGFTTFQASDQSMPTGGTPNPTLTVTLSGSGTVTGGSVALPTAISCQPTCVTTAIPINTQVTLTAAAAAGSTFTGWSGPCSGTGSCIFTLAGNTTATATFTSSGGTTNADADYRARCGAAGVIKCHDFDSVAWLPNHDPTNALDRGWQFGVATNAAGLSIDTTTKVSGAGSLRMKHPAATPIAAASFHTHFSPCQSQLGLQPSPVPNPTPSGAFRDDPVDCTSASFANSNFFNQGGMNPGDTVFVQYRIRYDANATTPGNFQQCGNTNFFPPGCGGTGLVPVANEGMKLSDTNLADLPGCLTGSSAESYNCPTSCPDQVFEQVTTGGDGTQVLQAYANCRGGPFAFHGFVSGVSGGWHSNQNVFNNPNNPPPAQPPCISSTEPTGCFVIVPNQWMTIKIKIHFGHFNQMDTEFTLWAGLEGQPLKKIVECTAAQPSKCDANYPGAVNGITFNLYDPHTAGSGGDGPDGSLPVTGPWKVGKFLLENYVTSAQWVVNEANVWFDELIISQQDIADPQCPGPNCGGTPTPPATPSGFHFIP